MDMYDKRVRVSHTYRAQRGCPFGNPGGEAARMSAAGAHVAATRPSLAGGCRVSRRSLAEQSPRDSRGSSGRLTLPYLCFPRSLLVSRSWLHPRGHRTARPVSGNAVFRIRRAPLRRAFFLPSAAIALLPASQMCRTPHTDCARRRARSEPHGDPRASVGRAAIDAQRAATVRLGGVCAIGGRAAAEGGGLSPLRGRGINTGLVVIKGGD
ncbi:hypothetical protein P3T24_006511 [Paraburkholderia sp. GAS33]